MTLTTQPIGARSLDLDIRFLGVPHVAEYDVPAVAAPRGGWVGA